MKRFHVCPRPMRVRGKTRPPAHAFLLATLIALALGAAHAAAAENFITLASTTSTQNSGFFEHLLPRFQAKTGIEVRVVAVGTGQALALGTRGDADVLLVHDRAAEEKFVAGGHGAARYDVMYNDFILVGPESDPAGVRGTKDVAVALARISRRRSVFVSRGDDSGTHRAELRLWKDAGIDPKAAPPEGYRELGAGMGAALNTAAGMDAYLLADRGTWLSFKNRQRLTIVLEGDPRLFNPYGVIPVNPERHPHIKKDAALVFVRWLLGPEGQAAIADFKIGGEPLFFPSAKGSP